MTRQTSILGQAVQNTCVRAVWFTSITAALVLLFVIASLPIRWPSWLLAAKTPFQPFLTVEEAELIIAQSEPDPKPHATPDDTKVPKPTWSIHKIILLSSISLLEALTWLAVGSYRIDDKIHHGQPNETVDPFILSVPFVIASTWFYAAVRPIVRPTATPPYDIFTLSLISLTWASLELGITLYGRFALGFPPPPTYPFVGLLVNITALIALLVVVVSMPVGIPSARVLEFKQVSCPSSLSSLI